MAKKATQAKAEASAIAQADSGDNLEASVQYLKEAGLLGSKK